MRAHSRPVRSDDHLEDDMQQDHDPWPRITLREENRVAQLGLGTLAVQPDRESSDANAG
jgi:hypothetical protein